MRNRLTAFLRYHCFCWSLALVFAGCGKDKDSFDGEKAPYGPLTPTTQVQSTLAYSPTSPILGEGNSQVTTVVGQTTIAGVTYDRLATTQVGKPGKGGEYWIKQDDKGMVAFAGFSHSDLHTGLVPAAATTFASPIMLNLNAPIGQPQAVTTTASVKLAGSATATTAQLTGQYTLVEKDATVATGMGPLSGCSHFAGEAQTDSPGVPALFRGRTVKADLWHHPSYGVVAFNVPELGLGTIMTDANDCGSVDESNHRTIRKTGVVDATSSLKVSTYTCDGNQFAADKNTHASMLLELRWVDEAQAKTDLQPKPRVEFGTTMGYFPHLMVESPTSVFHPEENGKGFKYWYAYVNQGAKNSAGDESVSYRIEVGSVAGLAPVRATARLYYKVLPDKVGPMPDAGVSPGVGADGGTPTTPTDAGKPGQDASCMIGEGGSTSGTAEWGQFHLKYTITGAALATPPAYTAPFGYDIYNYSGTLNGSALTISGTGVVDNPSSANDDFNYTLTASVTVGSDTKNYKYTAPKDEKLNKNFSLSVPIPPGATTGSFSMRIDYANSLYGPRGVAVGGTISGTSCPTASDGGATVVDAAGTSKDTRAIDTAGTTTMPDTRAQDAPGTGGSTGTSCSVGSATTTATAGTLDLFGTPVYFNGGAPLAAGRYRLRYVDGCMKYGESQGWTVNAYASGGSCWFVVGATTSERYAVPPGTVGYNIGSGGFASFEECVAASRAVPPVEFELPTTSVVGVWLSDSPYSDNMVGVDGRNPQWELDRVTSSCPSIRVDGGSPDAGAKDTASGCGSGGACPVGQQCLSGQCCVPPAAGGDCSANPACGCPAGQICAPASTRVMACFAGNNVAEGADCSAGLTCRAGLGCFDGICRPYCNSDVDCPAVAGVQRCLPTYWDDQQTQAILGVKVCARICDPSRPQNPHAPLLSCPAGFGCGSAPTGDSFCFKAGTSPAGAACTSTANCLPGYVCTGPSATALVCTNYCLSNSDCAGGTTCQFAWTPRQYAGTQEVGYCQ